jgi:hypothetical protein
VTGAAIGGGVRAFQIGVDFDRRHSSVPMAQAMQTVLVGLVVSVSALVAWVVGYVLGYRRGVKDAILGTVPDGGHRFNGE